MFRDFLLLLHFLLFKYFLKFLNQGQRRGPCQGQVRPQGQNEKY